MSRNANNNILYNFILFLQMLLDTEAKGSLNLAFNYHFLFKTKLLAQVNQLF